MADKLTTILNNVSLVYQRGFEEGKKTCPSPRWDLQLTYNLFGHKQAERYENVSVEEGELPWRQYTIESMVDMVLQGIYKIILYVPSDIAPSYEDSHTSFLDYNNLSVFWGIEIGETIAEEIRHATTSNGTIAPAEIVTNFDHSEINVRSYLSCYIKPNSDGIYNLPPEWKLEVYKLAETN